MERSTWTNGRLDDRFDEVDRRFDRVDRELGLLRSEINDLRLVIIRGNWTMIAGLVGVIAAVLVRGA